MTRSYAEDKADSWLWGLSVLLPFVGPVTLLILINDRRRNAKYGVMTKQAAETSIRNYCTGFLIAQLLVLALNLLLGRLSESDYSYDYVPVIFTTWLIIFIFLGTIMAISAHNNIKRIEAIQRSTSDDDNILRRKFALLELDLRDQTDPEILSDINNRINDFTKVVNQLGKDSEWAYKIYRLRSDLCRARCDNDGARKFLNKAYDALDLLNK